MRLQSISSLACIALRWSIASGGACLAFRHSPSIVTPLGSRCSPSVRDSPLDLHKRVLHQRTLSPSILFGSSDDGGGDSGEERPVNDLDIFGEPKDKSRKVVQDEGEIRGPNRIKSCIPYMLPLIDGDNFGKYIYERIPPLGNLDYVLLRPLVDLFHAVPALSIIMFMIFALGPQLTNQPREVRFNSQQAILIDVALIFPQLIGEAVAEADAKLPRGVMEPSSNFVWYFYVSLVVYCVVSNLRGKIPNQIPFISSAADYAVGPF